LVVGICSSLPENVPGTWLRRHNSEVSIQNIEGEEFQDSDLVRFVLLTEVPLYKFE